MKIYDKKGKVIGEIYEEKQSPLIALVVGHSSKSQGAYGDAGISEYEFNDELINDIVEKCPDLSLEIFYRNPNISGYTNQMTELHKRIKKAKCDYAIEFHFNSFSSTTVTGHEVLYASSVSEKLARIFNDNFNIVGFNKDRGVKKITGGDNGYGFCNNKEIPSIIIEPFFGSRQSSFVVDGVKRDRLVGAIVGSLKGL